MKVYTNISIESKRLAEISKLIHRSGVDWVEYPDTLDSMIKKFKEMLKVSKILVESKTSFLVVRANYNFEGYVDRSDLHSGNFTYSEELVVSGYTPKLGRFEKRKITRTKVPPEEGGWDTMPSGDKLDNFLSHIKEILR
ncbi:MAG: hypothetical protein WCT07_01020 [Candidatus Paceibacterota bacterium]|jgi:hypothetical protein